MEFSKVLEAIKVRDDCSSSFAKYLKINSLTVCMVGLQANFNDKYEENRKKRGGGIMGSKSQAKTKAKARVLAKEAAQRMN